MRILKCYKRFLTMKMLGPDVDYVIYYKEYRPDLGAYPLPDYVSAIPYLESDAEIANFTLQNIKNNLSAGYVVSFNNGQPNDEEMREIERRFKDYATGADNAGKPFVIVYRSILRPSTNYSYSS